MNSIPIRSEGKCVVYWMTAFRRVRYNFALQRACEIASELKSPLLILEPLRVRYRWACDRFHQFVIDGMRDNAEACDQSGVVYHSYIEPSAGDQGGLMHELSNQACAVVGDDFPCFFHPQMFRRLVSSIQTRFELVDSNGLMPLSVADRTFTVAHSYRRWMQKTLPKYLEDMPLEDPISQLPKRQLPASIKKILKRWSGLDRSAVKAKERISTLAINHDVAPVKGVQGGSMKAGSILSEFLDRKLKNYEEDRNEPDETGSSGLSPYMHFGHISAQEVFLRVMGHEGWNPGNLQVPNGKVRDFWGVGSEVEAFLDQLCTWREIGFNMSWREPRYTRYSSLPDWALKTLDDHQNDPREYVYSLEEFEGAATHDPIWNAAQRQLVREGRIHNYLRMLWGKKILHWTANARDALRIMIELNNKYALDGRDPNSYSGIFWVLGRYDRAWGPERPIFGKVRYMTSENTAKKHRLVEYLHRFESLDCQS